MTEVGAGGPAGARADRTVAADCYIPVASEAIRSRLASPGMWPDGEARNVRILFRYLDHWRTQGHFSRLVHFNHEYAAFNPGGGLPTTPELAPPERAELEKRFLGDLHSFAIAANFSLMKSVGETIATRDIPTYPLDVRVDLTEYDLLRVYYRGISEETHVRRPLHNLLRKRERLGNRTYRSILLVFKARTEEAQIEHLRRENNLSERAARRRIRTRRARSIHSPRPDCIYIKLIDNIPQSDLEMLFHNVAVSTRLRDKLMLGVLGLLTFFFAWTGPVSRIINDRLNRVQVRYLRTMVATHYFNVVAQNDAIFPWLASNAAQEDFKEEMLVYSVLAKEGMREGDAGSLDSAISQWLESAFGTKVEFRSGDALERLIRDGLVAADGSGLLRALPPRQAAARIDAAWDQFLDDLPDVS